MQSDLARMLPYRTGADRPTDVRLAQPAATGDAAAPGPALACSAAAARPARTNEDMDKDPAPQLDRTGHRRAGGGDSHLAGAGPAHARHAARLRAGRSAARRPDRSAAAG